MTYDARERSRHGGQPVESYRFAQGARVWLFTSADRAVALASGVYAPEVIERTELDFSQEDPGETIEISTSRTNPVAGLFIGEIPSLPVWVTVFRAHRGDEDLAIAIFTGRILRARFEESEAVLTAASFLALLGRSVPTLTMQTPCNHVLFSAECGANPTISRDLVTITEVEGSRVISNDFAARTDQWFRSGRLETPSGESRLIVDHQGSIVRLLSPLPGLASLDQVWAYWGCDHLDNTCLAKFANLPNHLGWSRLPSRNPFFQRIA